MEGAATYSIKTAEFEGPLELLLDLIEKRKFFINDISLAEVADDYIAYINRIDNFPVTEVSNFLLIASALVLIKSKSLLPTLELSDEEEKGIENLESRLKVYRKLKELSNEIRVLYKAQRAYTRERDLPSIPVFTPDASTTVVSLAEAMRRVLETLPRKKRIPQTSVEKTVRLEDVIERMTARIKQSLRMSFQEFARQSASSDKVNKSREDAKKEIVVSFLALLELLKRGSVRARQDRTFEDISIETGDVETPEYVI